MHLGLSDCHRTSYMAANPPKSTQTPDWYIYIYIYII